MVTIRHVTPEESIFFLFVIENFRFDGRKLTSLLYHTTKKKKKVFSSIHPFTIEVHIRLIKAPIKALPGPHLKLKTLDSVGFDLETLFQITQAGLKLCV